MEALLHYVVMYIAMPLLARSSRVVSVAADGSHHCRYSACFRQVVAWAAALFLLFAIVGLFRFQGEDRFRAFELFLSLAVIIVAVWVCVAAARVKYTAELVAIRRWPWPSRQFRVANVVRVETVDRGWTYTVCTTDGKSFRLSRFMNGVDVLVETLQARESD